MKILIIIILCGVGFVLFVRYIESRSIFLPTRLLSMTPKNIGLDFDDVYFKTADGFTLNGWYVPASSTAGTLLCFHGNAGNLGHRLEKIKLFHSLGINIFMIDYRGYGNSQGTPSEQGMYEDALAAHQYLTEERKILPERIVVYGDSLGGAAAVDLANRKPVAGLIVDSSFTNAADMSQVVFPFLPSFLLKSKLDSVSKVKTITIPKLFIHSINDEIVPMKLGLKLYESAAEPKTFIEIAGGHNTNHLDSMHLWTRTIKKFLTSLNVL